MEAPQFNIITRCSRTKDILRVKDSIFCNKNTDIIWWITFDVSSIKDIDAELLFELQDERIRIRFAKSVPGDYGREHNYIIDQIDSGWVYILDDDNLLHESLMSTITSKIIDNDNIGGFIFSQKVDGKDFSGLDIREAIPDNVKVSKIDMAQFIIKRSIIGDTRFKTDNYKTDGYFIEEIYENNKKYFVFIKDVLCYYNKLYVSKMPASLPKILLLGENFELKSNKYSDYEDDRLNVKFVTNESISKEISEFDPDAITSISSNFSEFTNLCDKSSDIRKRWINVSKESKNIGESTYQCAMNYILNPMDDTNPLISFFTPIYNTGDKLIRTYNSIISQSYSNWEWVIVNDSSDEGKTLKIAESLASNDSRIKLYDFRKKSNGVIGESKYRAACLSRGKYIMELDHDDIITEDAGKLMVDAFKLYTDCKFVFSDCAEIDENYNSLTYGDGFAFGYGQYRTENYKGRDYKVAVCQNINPITIRHIVGVPNHFRAWDREFYHSIGGHNRRLTIADDYELIIRSFLNTKFVGIRELCYLQFFHNSDNLNNTQNSCRADIQRRVRTISQYYNNKIRDRFEELGIEDYAYNENPDNPLRTKPRYGNMEGVANYIHLPRKINYVI